MLETPGTTRSSGYKINMQPEIVLVTMPKTLRFVIFANKSFLDPIMIFIKKNNVGRKY